MVKENSNSRSNFDWKTEMRELYKEATRVRFVV